MIRELRFRVACLIAGDMIDLLAARAGERQFLRGFRRGVEDAQALAKIRERRQAPEIIWPVSTTEPVRHLAAVPLPPPSAPHIKESKGLW